MGYLGGVIMAKGIVKKVAFISSFKPRKCGIATFTTDLVESLSAEAPDIDCWAVALNDKPEGYTYPAKVRFVITQNRLAGELSQHKVPLICLDTD